MPEDSFTTNRVGESPQWVGFGWVYGSAAAFCSPHPMMVSTGMMIAYDRTWPVCQIKLFRYGVGRDWIFLASLARQIRFRSGTSPVEPPSQS